MSSVLKADLGQISEIQFSRGNRGAIAPNVRVSLLSQQYFLAQLNIQLLFI